MMQLMYDGLVLGDFINDDNKLRLVLKDNIKGSWLPYLFEIAYNKGIDMTKVIEAWKKERVFPKNRFGSIVMLKELGLKKYDVQKICEVTRCSLVTDPYWISYEESDTYTSKSVRGQLGLDSYPYNSLELDNEEAYVWKI